MDFKEAKQKKERGTSVEESILEILQEKDKYEDVIIVGVTKENEIEFSYSVENNGTAIGYLEVVKQHFIDEITITD